MVTATLVTAAVCGLLQAPAAPAAPPTLRRGALEMGVLGGYGDGTVFDPQRTPTSIVQLMGRLAVHFGAIGSGRMRGNFAIVAEGLGIWIDQSPAARGGGINLLGRYTWAGERWRPMFLFGAGVIFTDEEVPPGETEHNFSPQAGLGLQYLVREEIAVGAEYRFHHLSNNGATASNPGINSHLILFGVSWYR